MKILVVMGREPVCVLFGLRQTPGTLHRLRIADEVSRN